MKKRIAVIVAVLALLGAAGFVWKRHAGEKSSATETASGAAAGPGGISVGGQTAGGPTVPTRQGAWLTQTGAPGRRIAGRVLSQGAPLVGARVRLGNVTTEAGGVRGGDELASVSSGPDGMFDFGVQPAATYVVSAEFADKTAASVVVASANPAAKPAPDKLVLSLEGCHSKLHGLIVDASGGGIAKARLSVAGLGGAESSTTGEYSLCVPLGDSRVRIVADGYGALDMPIHLVGALERNFELVPEAVVTGLVVDEANKPVPGARVLAIPQAIEQPHFLGEGAALADDTGHFRIENLAPGRFLLAASADGLGTSAPKAAVATAGTGAEVTLVMTARARVSGKVVMGGTGVGGARVSVIRPGVLVARASYSQPDGSFVLDDVPLGQSKLDAGEYEIVKPTELTVKTTQMDNVTIEVSELASMRGRVTRKGKPMADSVVIMFTGRGPGQTRTDENGDYELRGLPGGAIQGYAQSFGDAPAFAKPDTVQLTPGKVTEKNWELDGAATVQGTVVDEAGNPVPNVYVRLIEPKGDLGESMTDAQGNFLCTSMLGGADYRPAVFPSPGARTAFPPATTYAAIKLADGEAAVKGVTIAIRNQRLSIAGRVVDDSGAAVADVHVEAIGRGYGGGNPSMLPSVRADVNGTFTIGDLAPGPYTLHAHAGDGSEVEVADIPAGAKGVELHVLKPGWVEGTLAGFSTPPRVHARQMTNQLFLDNEAVIDGNTFTITGLTPGKWLVEALGKDGNAGQSVVIKAGTAVKVKLESKGSGTIKGTLTEFGTNKPIAGMTCVAAQSMGGQAGDAGPPAPNSASDATGTFTIPAPVGKARVMCFSPDGTFSAAGGDVDVAAGTPASIALKAVRAVPPPCDPGFRIKPMTLPLVIAGVDADGPAKAGGLAVGDIVTSIDGGSVAGLLPAGAMMLAWNHRPGTTLVMGVERGGAPQTIKIVVKAAQD